MSLTKELSNLLSTFEVQDLSQVLSDHACVAIILRGESFKNLEIGLIQRAHRPNDRWSGQIAFPGGRKEPQDLNDIATAQRETFEEVGIRLSLEELAGRINDIQARKAGHPLEFYIRPVVFYIQRDPEVLLQSSEVADFFWIPVSTLLDPNSQITHLLEHELEVVELPGISLGREVPLWGLTYMMIQDLLIRLKKII